MTERLAVMSKSRASIDPLRLCKEVLERFRPSKLTERALHIQQLYVERAALETHGKVNTDIQNETVQLLTELKSTTDKDLFSIIFNSAQKSNTPSETPVAIKTASSSSHKISSSQGSSLTLNEESMIAALKISEEFVRILLSKCQEFSKFKLFKQTEGVCDYSIEEFLIRTDELGSSYSTRVTTGDYSRSESRMEDIRIVAIGEAHAFSRNSMLLRRLTAMEVLSVLRDNFTWPVDFVTKFSEEASQKISLSDYKNRNIT
jgi:hypothetical protein